MRTVPIAKSLFVLLPAAVLLATWQLASRTNILLWQDVPQASGSDLLSGLIPGAVGALVSVAMGLWALAKGHKALFAAAAFGGLFSVLCADWYMVATF